MHLLKREATCCFFFSLAHNYIRASMSPRCRDICILIICLLSACLLPIWHCETMKVTKGHPHHMAEAYWSADIHVHILLQSALLNTDFQMQMINSQYFRNNSGEFHTRLLKPQLVCSSRSHKLLYLVSKEVSRCLG